MYVVLVLHLGCGFTQDTDNRFGECGVARGTRRTRMRRHGGGRVPDKSEQRKSSGEATHEQDPRFAVFRESAADGSPEAAVDHSTAVLTVRGLGKPQRLLGSLRRLWRL